MSPIPVLHSFARSGGTLVNQLLGVHADCLVLSEVNPAASFKSVEAQAVEWLGLVAQGDAGDFTRLGYAGQLRTLHERAADRGKRLVVRDWPTVNFLAGCAGERTTPSGVLEQGLYLERAGLLPLPLVVARRAAAVYRSIRRSFGHLADLDAPTFAGSYLAYARAVAEFPRVHIESLRERPRDTLLEILRILGLEAGAADDLLARFHTFTKCTGNTTLRAAGESASAREVLPAEQPAAEDARLAQEQPALAEADRLLGYV